ncbi:TLC domain-containing protein [Dunaliella salina]|uniref:TLC domain-containing protein n=1 Tax=Dunaliella salina TaxID=3046 RepID=A0ABQ7G4Q9_DUNSA|nr:TLC domain-containing protein [Dunaliella salina]|eukprot:KAF5829579.1 TLC domain-containing protein [Dunaliella salina]
MRWLTHPEESLLAVSLPQLAGLELPYLHTPLVQADGLLTPQGCGVLAGVISTVLCFVMYKGSRALTPPLSKVYKHLSLEDRRNWDTRYASVFHAVSCVYFAYRLLWEGDLFWKDADEPLVRRTSAGTYMALGISTGYFSTDFVTCVKYNMGGTEMVLHHIGSLLSVAMALMTGDGHMHTLWMLSTEFTTPLINNRWWLDKMGMKSSILYVINGLSIAIFWVPARLYVFVPYFITLWETRDQLQYVTFFSKILIVVIPIILSILNLIWFRKIMIGVYKVLSKPERKEGAKTQ